jgi:3-oxoacyl-[acyl-carrier-protein] synthase-3
MDGKKLYRTARKYLGPFFAGFSPDWPDPVDDITAVISHQTTRHGLLALTHHGVPEELIVMTLPKLGNCVAASIPMTLFEAISSGRIKRGDRFLIFGPGAGFSVGAALMEY